MEFRQVSGLGFGKPTKYRKEKRKWWQFWKDKSLLTHDGWENKKTDYKIELLKSKK